MCQTGPMSRAAPGARDKPLSKASLTQRPAVATPTTNSVFVLRLCRSPGLASGRQPASPFLQPHFPQEAQWLGGQAGACAFGVLGAHPVDHSLLLPHVMLKRWSPGESQQERAPCPPTELVF